ncbi:conserved hypothetical protein [Ricinus communis]|uniref:Uncharacterized protein n=1 Tax=Ricinus communis TaxID=3988 RepID=B9S0L9_RICCO|nr:conserved hypothetical protein [Ricinus communis]
MASIKEQQSSPQLITPIIGWEIVRWVPFREIKDLSSWIEVAPILFISLRKTSNSPGLETITEEETEDCEDDL